MIYWIAHIDNCRIGISAKPKGFEELEAEILNFKAQQIDWIISLLEDWEIEQFGLSEAENICVRHNIKFDRLPIPDNSIPGFHRFADKINKVYAELSNTGCILVHCHHGQGRSGLFVAGLLLRSGITLDSALVTIEKYRGFRCPSSAAQIRFLSSYHLSLKNCK
ncbi:MAG TPA: protein-tyrosine phosphatase family protein [Prolixibacteraceae bacterium]|nr:protein-tyrosine phosphatase family protein [Prolixibacteraceae bacterium]